MLRSAGCEDGRIEYCAADRCTYLHLPNAHHAFGNVFVDERGLPAEQFCDRNKRGTGINVCFPRLWIHRVLRRFSADVPARPGQESRAETERI